MTDAEILAAIRADLAAIAPGIWMRAADGDGEFVEARGEFGELVPVCRIDPGATDAEKRVLAETVDRQRFLLGLVDRAADVVRRLRAEVGGGEGRGASVPAARGKDYAAQAAMLCPTPAFLRFLADKHGLEQPLTEERAAQKVRSLCGVTSRAELNDGGACMERWKSLAADFENWKRAG